MRRDRLSWLFITLLICFIYVYVNIVKLQYKKSDELSVIADSQYTQKEWVSELEFKLLDSTKKDLLEYVTKYNAVILPNIFIRNNTEVEREEVLKLIYILKNYNEDYDLSEGQLSSESQKLYFPIDKETYEKLKRIENVKGFYVYSYEEVDRSEAWKIENILSSTRNLIDNSLKNVSSLEMQIKEKVKDNNRPYKEFELDMDGNITVKENTENKLKRNFILTVDRNFQDEIKELLNDKYKDYEQVGVVVVESQSGKIEAMVQKNDRLPNVNIGAETLNGFFPGSIFKTIILEGVLEEGKASLEEKLTCEGLYESKKDKDRIGHGELTVEEAYVISCNDIYSQLGNRLGEDKLMELLNAQNIFSKVLGFEKEQKGALESKGLKIEDGSLGITAIGQNIRLTPLQAVGIVNTIVNEGVYIKPQLIMAMVDHEGKMIEEYKTNKERVISKETSEKIKTSMKKVVDEGTGLRAKVEGFEVGGKTGSTERMENGEKLSDGWFIGYFKKENKYYTAVVFVKNINKDSESGGSTAAPIFSDIVNIK